MEAVSTKTLIDYTTTLKVEKFLHDHTKIIKITRIALDILALITITVGLSAATISWSLIASASIVLILIEIAHFALSFFGYLSVTRADRPFTEKTFGNSRIYYKDEIPTLEINEKTHKEAGYAHGYLAGEGILLMLKRMHLIILFTSLGKELDQIVTENYQTLLDRIPEKYLEELEGVVEGANARKNESFFGRRLPDITILNLLAIHNISSLFSLGTSIKQSEPLAACTTIIDSESVSKTPIIGRNLDWMSYGALGKTSLVKHQKIGNAAKMTDITFAGCIGTTTGFNNTTGLFAAMNISSLPDDITENNYMISPLFYNRWVLEQSGSAKDASRKHLLSESNKPDVPYHLTIADKTDAFALHFYQGSFGNSTTVRTLEEKPIITLNATYQEDSDPTFPIFFHEERTKNLETSWDHPTKDQIADMKRRLCLPYVNNSLTMHSVIFSEGKLIMTLPDNGFAASNKWVTIN